MELLTAQKMELLTDQTKALMMELSTDQTLKLLTPRKKVLMLELLTAQKVMKRDILPATIKVVTHLDAIFFPSLLLGSDALFPTILT